jgi:hypothetical protein
MNQLIVKLIRYGILMPRVAQIFAYAKLSWVDDYKNWPLENREP